MEQPEMNREWRAQRTALWIEREVASPPPSWWQRAGWAVVAVALLLLALALGSAGLLGCSPSGDLRSQRDAALALAEELQSGARDPNDPDILARLEAIERDASATDYAQARWWRRALAAAWTRAEPVAVEIAGRLEEWALRWIEAKVMLPTAEEIHSEAMRLGLGDVWDTTRSVSL